MELSDLLGEELLAFCSDDIREDMDASAFDVLQLESIPEDIDTLFASAFDAFEFESIPNPTPTSTIPVPSATQCHTSSTPTTSARRFAPPKTEQEIQEARIKGIPKKTLEDTQYCVKVWEEWCSYRRQVCQDTIPPLQSIEASQLQHWLTRFVLEVRKRNGKEYSPDTLHHLCCGIMRFLRWNGWPSVDFFADIEFIDFRATLDAEMKRLQVKGIGSKKKQAEPLTEQEEEILWEKGMLGDANPQTLLDTIVFMNGLYFALRSGDEHRALRSVPPQIEVVEREGERPYLLYTEDTSKNRPGGLKGRRVKPKVVRHHANTENPNRCFIRLFKLYTSLCPSDRPKDAFYLKPLNKPTPTCWYSKQPLGHNKLAQTVGRLCKAAGIQGYKTNHSLRVATATRLYKSGVDEQLVMERTGHRSVEGVRTYKRTSDEQQVALSDVLNRAKRSRIGPLALPPPNTARPLAMPHSNTAGPLPMPQTLPSPDVCATGPLQANLNTQLQAAVTQQNSSSASIPGHFCFNSCSSVTINFNCNKN